MRKRNMGIKLYFKYIVKSQLLFWIYVGIFLGVFIVLATHLQLENRSAYDAKVSGNNILISGDIPSLISDKIIYIYSDKNERVTTLNMEKAEITETALYITVSENAVIEDGNVTVELVTGKRNLLEVIFTKAGTNR